MRLQRIELRNVGPFEEATVDLLQGEPEPRPVQFFTGLNGGGKSILLDAVRFWFGGQYGYVERDLPRSGHEEGFAIDVTLGVDGRILREVVSSPFHARETQSRPPNYHIWGLPQRIESLGAVPTWVVDYWAPGAIAGSPVIRGFQAPEHQKVLNEALRGSYPRGKVTELLCAFDYLRDSRDDQEKAAGEALHAVAERIIAEALLDGRYVGVRRATFTPVVEQAGHVVPLANVSSGNAYFIQRMIALLGRMYAVSVLGRRPLSELCETPGLLLIDEVENHLHPRWQKRFVPAILEIFPRLQVVATTHSPFVLTSVPDARVHVCRYDRARHVCTVREETASLTHKPVDEVLLSSAFDETQPFGEEITKLLAQRREAVRKGNAKARARIEAKLVKLNPTYFSYLEVVRGATPRGAEG